MAEVLVSFNDTITGTDGLVYRARACGREMDDGRWEGWIEFEATDGSGVLRSARETTQPNRVDTAYWATGLTPVYLEGALDRALHPLQPAAPIVEEEPAFDGPRPASGEEAPLHTESVLNPFSVYRKGEPHLRRQLAALAGWHLLNIIAAHELSEQSPTDLARLTTPELIELIVAGVRQRATETIES
ncbi:MAG TPA: hypothetical protein VJ813_19955 [Vicinamibacterales bacterium]|nr:hypothetical protein [Vicinamibacterales bacterium]